MWSPEDRWERIAQGMLWIAGLFGVFTVYGVYSGDDWRGLVMTAAPGVICLGIWYLARVRLDHLIGSSIVRPLWLKITSGALVVVGAAILVLVVLGLVWGPADRQTERDRAQRMLQNFDTSNLEVVDVPAPGGGTMKSLRRKATPAPPSLDDLPECLEGETLVAEPTADDPNHAVCKPLPSASDLVH